MDRETVACPGCGAGTGEPCDGDLGMVFDDGVERRAVHASRYAHTLPPDEVSAFWEGAIGRYLTEQMAAESRPPHRGGLQWPT